MGNKNNPDKEILGVAMENHFLIHIYILIANVHARCLYNLVHYAFKLEVALFGGETGWFTSVE